MITNRLWLCNTFLWLCSLGWVLDAHARELHLVFSGLGGNAEYELRFAQTLAQARDAIAENLPEERRDTDLIAVGPQESSKQRILSIIEQQAMTLEADDLLTVLLIGHGSYDGDQYRFNITGPDLTGEELKRALAGVTAARQLVVVATSASGVLLNTLEQPGRVVVTATKSGGEINAVEFPHYWVSALSSDGADTDRNEIVTAAEAFDYASRRVRQHYEEQQLLASEHARLQGESGASLTLVRIGALRETAGNPEIEALLDQRLLIEAQLNTLKLRKAEMDDVQYFDELEQLMLQMARLQIRIDELTGWSVSDG